MLKEADYNFIIKNKCLCEFRVYANHKSVYGFLEEYNESYPVPFKSTDGERYGYCVPAKCSQFKWFGDYVKGVKRLEEYTE